MGLEGIGMLRTYYTVDIRKDLSIIPDMTSVAIRLPLTQPIWRSGRVAMCHTMAMRASVHAKYGRIRSGLL
ncbi:MAG: hypothetical protein JWP91_4255 [Fibrobacteres bacterium]|nr:hypothetical protein [Fibrobacterota bacterium]